MALTIKLKPQESILISGALIRNGDTPAELKVLNKVPLLRHKDILLEDQADTPCKQLYYLIQWMYFDSTTKLNAYQTFLKNALAIVRAAPSTAPHLDRIQDLLVKERHYQALKETAILIQYEQELISNVEKSSDYLPENKG